MAHGYDQFPSIDVSTAYHEAGHAVACFVTSKPVKHVSIVPDGESLGVVTYMDNLDAFDALVVTCAGPAAEILLHRILSSDPLPRATFDAAVGDELSSLVTPEIDIDTVMEYWQDALNIIDDHARSVIAIADALLERRFLSGDEARALWESADH